MTETTCRDDDRHGWDCDLYNDTVRFAADAHQGQTVPGSQRPYLLHLSQVCQEALCAVVHDPTLNGNLVMQCALLHDTIEDTAVEYAHIENIFGTAVAQGVNALTKRVQRDGQTLSKSEQMADSLARICAQPREVAVVKLADRITNLQRPPSHWSKAKRRQYHIEAQTIYDALRQSSAYLAKRCLEKLDAYAQYFEN